MKAEIIAVGSELLTPDRVDTNSLFLTAQLNRLGIEVTRKTVVGDELAALRNAFDEAAKRVELVIASGGLGPTADDRTRDAVADLLGRGLSKLASGSSRGPRKSLASPWANRCLPPREKRWKKLSPGNSRCIKRRLPRRKVAPAA